MDTNQSNPYLAAGNTASLLRHLFDLYNYHKRCLALSKHGIYPNQGRLTDIISYNFIIDQTLAQCTIHTRMIIRNEYQVPMEDKHWYEAYWSRSTYSRRKKKAAEEFLTLLYQNAGSGPYRSI